MIRATIKLLAILSTCANAKLPWDNDIPNWDPTWDPFLPLCEWDRQTAYVLCCGHTISPKFAAKLKSAGIMKDGEPDRFGRTTITIDDAGREMLAQNEGRLKAAYP